MSVYIHYCFWWLIVAYAVFNQEGKQQLKCGEKNHGVHKTVYGLNSQNNLNVHLSLIFLFSSPLELAFFKFKQHNTKIFNFWEYVTISSWESLQSIKDRSLRGLNESWQYFSTFTLDMTFQTICNRDTEKKATSTTVWLESFWKFTLGQVWNKLLSKNK